VVNAGGKPELLFVSPVVPALTGNGLAMRAGLVLEALSARHAVSLLVFRLYAGPGEDLPPELRRLCRRTAILPPGGAKTPGFWARRIGALAPFHRASFDVIHVFRLATLPLVHSLLERRVPRPRLHLDLDDIDSVTRTRIAALCRANGDLTAAVLEDAEARRAISAEREALHTADRVYVSSEADRRLLASQGGRAELRVLPNGVRIPASLAPEPGVGPFRFLFIGTLGYYPNEDAALLLCREIAPAVRKWSAVEVAFEVVGGGASPRLREAARCAGVHLLGAVPDVKGVYGSAGAMVVPLRAAGGTRIKILEAFSYGRPVVSTSIGAEGLAVAHERELLIGDAPDEIAAACARLAGDRELRARLATRGLDLVNRAYSPTSVERALDESW
jgi:glycosyltransferase involved in cell wall biosynthesis